MTMPSDDPAPPRSLFGRLVTRWRPSAEPAPALQDDESPSRPDEALLVNAARFSDLRVADVMVPRADVIAVEIDTPLAELARRFTEAAHSRLPIYRETLDDPVGVAHIKDLIPRLSGEDEAPRDESWAQARILPAIRRPLLYAPPSMRAADLLVRMQSRRMHMALVVDEFGGTDGLVTLEDLIEPIVGDIEDEHDDNGGPDVRAKGPHVWEADARAAIDEFEALVGRPVATPEEEEDVDTLGGLVFLIAGRVPERGEVIRHSSGFEFEVMESDGRRIKRLRVRPVASEESDAGASAP